MRRASNRLLKIYGSALAPIGLKAAEFALLAEIRRRVTATLPELADVFQCDRYSLRYKLSPLEKARFVEVTPDARDARSRRVTLTSAGLAKLEEAMPLWRSAQLSIEEAIGATEAARLRSSANLLSVAHVPAPSRDRPGARS